MDTHEHVATDPNGRVYSIVHEHYDNNEHGHAHPIEFYGNGHLVSKSRTDLHGDQYVDRNGITHGYADNDPIANAYSIPK